MNEREKLEGRITELRRENMEMQGNLANVRQTEQALIGRLDQNVGAQKELQRMVQEQGEENTGEGEPAKVDTPPAEAEDKPGPALKEVGPDK